MIFNLFSAWQWRRVVITKEEVSFAFLSHDEELDCIPLAEVEFVKEFNEDDVSVRFKSNDMNPESEYKLQIATKPEGHNAGRMYYLKTQSSETYQKLMKILVTYSKSAKKRVETGTLAQKIQKRVRAVYEHDSTQAIVAVIIVGVSSALTTDAIPNCIWCDVPKLL